MDGILNFVIVVVVSLFINILMVIEVEFRYIDIDFMNIVGMRWVVFIVVFYELINIGILVLCSNWFFVRFKFVVFVYM